MKNKTQICLPNFLKPNFKTNLLRVGKKNDGGYCIPRSSLKKTSILYSFGLNDDWSFEKEFREKSGAKIICFDHSVTLIFWIKRFIKDLIQFFLLKESIKQITKRFFTFFTYKIFFSKPNIEHRKLFFGQINHQNNYQAFPQIIDMSTILKKWEDKNYFMKVDIEGGEYKVLDQIIKYQNNLTGLAIEFHNCDLMLEKIRLFVKTFDLDLVHLHVNNYGSVNKEGFPSVLELTFSPKSDNIKREQNDNIFPVPSLDQPNNKNHEDLNIRFY